MSAPLCMLRSLLAAAAVAAALAPPAVAAGERGKVALHCLTPAEQRARTAAHVVVPLSKAMRAAKAKHGEVLRASLCERDGRLVYRLTLLRGGAVASTMIDAGNGAVISAH